MKSVRTGFGDHVDDAARGAAILRGEVVRGDPVLLDRVDVNDLTYRIGERLNVFDAVEQDLRAGGPLAVDLKTYSARVGVLRLILRRSIARADIAGDRDEVIGIACQRRQLRDLLLADDLRDFLGVGVDFRAAGSRGNADLLGALADAQFGVERGVAAYRDLNLLSEALEAGGAHRNLVGRRGQVGEGVGAIPGAGDGAGGVGADIALGDLRLGDDGTGGVGHHAVQGARVYLREAGGNGGEGKAGEGEDGAAGRVVAKEAGRLHWGFSWKAWKLGR